jgi:serine phosphatase RsbU (regulator of sigma subunit)/anti-sigma regulatory factor (Ser/Thr protein kinase)
MPSYQSLKALQVRLKPDLREIEPIRERFLGFLVDLGMDALELEGWKLVFTEMTANAIEHGKQSSETEFVRVVWWREGSTIFLETHDSGSGPSPEGVMNPTLPEDPLAEGGRGLFIIHSFVDHWEHWRRDDGGYFIRVRKGYARLAESDPEDPATELILDELADSYENLALYDNLGQAVAGGASFAEAYRSTLQVFLDSGSPDDFHIEAVPTNTLPEFEQIQDDTTFCRYGKADPKVWDALNSSEYFLWKGVTGAAGFVFQGKQEWRTEGCVVPLRHNQEVVALVALGYKQIRESMGSRIVRQLQALSTILGMALSRSIMDRERLDRDRMRHELNIATKLQQKLLPLDNPTPVVPGWDFFVNCLPAQEVAGDFAEVRKGTDGTIVGCIIDVMGKGISAAILAGIFRSHFISFARSPVSPADFLSTVNESLEDQLARHTMFITAIAFRLLPNSGVMELASAGHPPGIIVHAKGGISQLKALNPPLGLFADEHFDLVEIPFHPGDRCFFVTDGYFEWTTPQGEQFGWEALVEWLQGQGKLPPPDILKAFNLLAQGEQESASRDDQTLLVITRQ